LLELGTALPETNEAKLQYLWKIINEFSASYKNKLGGRYDKNAKFETFVSVLDMLKRYEYSNISIVTKK
jgi:biopolymer transport protein ExbD